MTTTLAIIGKSGSGKTTITKAFMKLFKEFFPDKTILLFDNDLSNELGHSFGLDIRNTIYGIRSGKHEYKTGIPSKMTKQEYIETITLPNSIIHIDDHLFENCPNVRTINAPKWKKVGNRMFKITNNTLYSFKIPKSVKMITK